MKIKHLLIGLILLVVNPFFSVIAQEAINAENIRQVLVPKEVFIGDKAQIQYSFISQIDFFAKVNPSIIRNDTLTFDPSIITFEGSQDKCTITDFQLFRNGASYTLVISFIPWNPGPIDFLEFDLNKICVDTNDLSEEVDIESTVPFIIDLERINVASIVNKMGIDKVQPAIQPQLLPGTQYIIWLFLILFILVIFLIIFVLVKFTVLLANWKIVSERIYQYKNAAKTKIRLRKLIKKNYSDEEFANEWQKIVRAYINKKYDYSFDSIPAGRLYSAIQKITYGMYDGKAATNVEEMCAMFTRCDYIKFAAGSIDSRLLPIEDHAAMFTEEERKGLVQNMIQIVDDLTSDEIEEVKKND